mgnify:CR=1 FL=1
MGRWSRRKYIALVLILLILPIAGVLTVNFVSGNVLATLEIKLVDEKGNPMQGSVAIYEVTPNGVRRIWSGSGFGTVMALVAVPSQEVGVAEIDGKVVKVYKAVNLDIVAGNKEKRKVGAVGVVIDPTFSGFVTHKSVTLVMRDAPSVEQEPPTGIWYQWEYTTVLSFATWDSIYAAYYYPVGAKIDIEKKSRPYGATTWAYAGTGTVTLDRGLSSGYDFYGRYNYNLKFEIEYYYYIYEIEGLYIECVGPVDTSTDPRAFTESSSSWSGQPPSGDSYYITPAGRTTAIPVTSGSDYAFSVTVSFSYPYSISVSLSLAKESSPTAYLYITSPASHGGYVKTVGIKGFQISYSNWV